MIRVSLALLLLATPVAADQIVPVFVETPGGFTQAILDKPVAIPAGATAIVGWSGWVWFLEPAGTLYAGLDWWHDGGTPHRLDQVIVSPAGSVFQNARTVMLANPGHRAVPGDQVFARFYCVGTPQPRCAASATVYFRVP